MGDPPVSDESKPVVQLASNPAAGKHSARRVAALAAALERAGMMVVQSECGPGRDLEVDARANHLCIVGGDGTVRHAARAIQACGRPVGMSFYPAGTINLLHREAPCELDPDRFADRILRRQQARSHYAATLGDGLFLACASVGPDSAAVAGVSPRLKRRLGRLAYGVAFLAVLWKWPRHRITLQADGRTIVCEAFYVAKGRYFAGPWSFAPDARVTDPHLHVVALTKATRRRYARFMIAMITGGPIERLPGTTIFTCRELSAECETPLPVQADGDMAGTLPVTISLRKEPFLFY